MSSSSLALLLSIFPIISFPTSTPSLLLASHNLISSTQPTTIESGTKSVEESASLAIKLSSSQNSVGEKAALEARKHLAALSLKWALFAKYLAYRRGVEVMDLTRRAQEALILSLKFESIATQLKSAVLSAQEVYYSAAQRSRALSTLAQMDQNHKDMSTKAHSFMQYVQVMQEKWARNEAERASNLSIDLQQVLNDLKRASEFANEAKGYAMMTTQYKPLHFSPH